MSFFPGAFHALRPRPHCRAPPYQGGAPWRRAIVRFAGTSWSRGELDSGPYADAEVLCGAAPDNKIHDFRGFSFFESPLTDSNRRPPLYEEGPRVKRWLLHRPVRAGGGRGELGSSLYRLLREDKADWSSLRWRISLRAVRRPGGRWRLWERRVVRGWG